MKIISLKKNQLHGQGRYGRYFRISQRRGVKIAKIGYKSKDYILDQIKKNKNLQSIVQEATLGMLARGTTRRLVIAKYEGLYYLGILQVHLIGKFCDFPEEIMEPLVLGVKRMLMRYEVLHADLHKYNLIHRKNKCAVIDFNPDQCRFVGDKKLYYTVKNRIIKEVVR